MTQPSTSGDGGTSPAPWSGHRYYGASVAVWGAVGAVAAFLFLPYQVTFGTMTAPEVIKYNAAEEPGWNLVWVVPVLCAIVAAMAAMQLGRNSRAPSSRLSSMGSTLGLATVAVGIYLLNIVVLAFRFGNSAGPDFSVADYLGSGFWIGFCGMLAACAGSYIELRNLQNWQKVADRWAGWR